MSNGREFDGSSRLEIERKSEPEGWEVTGVDLLLSIRRVAAKATTSRKADILQTFVWDWDKGDFLVGPSISMPETSCRPHESGEGRI